MNVFDASVTVHLVDRVSHGLGAMARSMTRSQTAADALNARLRLIGTTFASGIAMAGGGAALAAPLVFATKAALDLQTAMGRVQIQTQASNAQMSVLNSTLTKTANVTGVFSKPVLANFAAEMYATGIRDINQINEMLPMMAKGADIMKIMSHNKISPEESAHTFVSMAHQFGRYTAKEMAPIIEAAAILAPSLPGGLKTFKGMGSYVNVGGNRKLGIDPVELMALQAAVAQTSGGQGTGRGAMSGANVINALNRAMPGVFGAGLLSGKSAYAAEVLGLAHGGVSTVFRNQKLDLGLLSQKLSSFQEMSGPEIARRSLQHVDMLGKKAEEEAKFLNNFLKNPEAPKAQIITKLFKNMFGSADTIGMLLGDPKFLSQLNVMRDSVKSSKGIDAMQEEAMKMLEPQLLRLHNNFITLASTIGTQLIPVVTPLITKMGDFLDKLNSFAAAHPKIVQISVALLALASASLFFGGAIQILRAGFMGLQFVLAPLGGMIGRTLVAALGAVFSSSGMWLRVLGPLGIAIGAIALVVRNWDGIMQFVHNNQRQFIHIAAMTAGAIETLGSVLKRFAIGVIQVVSMLGSTLMGWIGQSNTARLIQAQGSQWINQFQNWRIDDVTARRDEKYLRSLGMGALVDGIKGPTKHPVQMAATKDFIAATVAASAKAHQNTKPTVVNQHINIAVNGSKHDPQQIAHAVKEKLAGELKHAMNGASGNSVGRSKYQGGHTTP